MQGAAAGRPGPRRIRPLRASLSRSLVVWARSDPLDAPRARGPPRVPTAPGSARGAPPASKVEDAPTLPVNRRLSEGPGRGPRPGSTAAARAGPRTTVSGGQESSQDGVCGLASRPSPGFPRPAPCHFRTALGSAQSRRARLSKGGPSPRPCNPSRPGHAVTRAVHGRPGGPVDGETI